MIDRDTYPRIDPKIVEARRARTKEFLAWRERMLRRTAATNSHPVFEATKAGEFYRRRDHMDRVLGVDGQPIEED